MQRFTRWVLGTASARVSGDTARFLNVAVRSGIVPLTVRRDGEDLLLTVRPGQYRALRPVRRRTGAKMRLAGKGGLPFLLARLWRRPGLIAGAVLAAMLYHALSGTYWGVSVEGDAPYAVSEILAAAKEAGAYVGARRDALDAGWANHVLEERLPKLSWAAVNTEGCFITVRVRAAAAREPAGESGGVYHVRAKRGGLVRRIEAERGTVVTKTGTYAEEGALLVSAVRTLGDPWGEAPLFNLYTHAKARVYAETRHSFTGTCALEEPAVREEPVGTRRALSVFGVRIPLSFSGAPEAALSGYRQTPLVLLGRALPVVFEEQRLAREVPVTVRYTPDEARARALERAETLLENYLPADAEVLRREAEVRVENGMATATLHCTLLEDIAEEVEMTAEERAEAEAKLLEPPM